MEKYLLVFEPDGLLKVNFDIALITALKEIRMLKALGKIDIPDIAIELHENTDSLWVSNSFIQHIVAIFHYLCFSYTFTYFISSFIYIASSRDVVKNCGLV
jgi:hypothetical protein